MNYEHLWTSFDSIRGIYLILNDIIKIITVHCKTYVLPLAIKIALFHILHVV